MNTPRGVWLDDLTLAEARARLADGAVVVVPVALGRMQGPQLPLKTNALIARALGQKLIDRMAVIVAPVVSVGLATSEETMLKQALVERLEDLRSQGARRLAVLDAAPAIASWPEGLPDVLLLRPKPDESDAGEIDTSLMFALEPRSLRIDLLPAASAASAFKGERALAGRLDDVAAALLARWPDLA